MNDQDYDDEPAPHGSGFPATREAPPTNAGDFVPVKPPEGWPTVVGVLSIVFGALGIVGGLCGVAGLLMLTVFLGLLPAEMRDQMEQQRSVSMPYPALQGAQLVVESALSIVLLAGGIMLLRRRPKAACVLTAFAAIDLLSNTLSAVLSAFVAAAAAAAMKQNPQLQQGPPGMAGMMQGLGMLSSVVTWVFAAIWPIFLLIWFRRAKTRASMDAWG